MFKRLGLRNMAACRIGILCPRFSPAEFRLSLGGAICDGLKLPRSDMKDSPNVGRLFGWLHPIIFLVRSAVSLSFVAGLLILPGANASFAATFNIADGDVTGLKSAITTANGNGQANTINLASGGTYTLTVV